MEVYGIFANKFDGFTYAVKDVLCKDENGNMYAFTDETVAGVFLLDNEESICEINYLTLGYYELYVDKIIIKDGF